MIHVGPQPDRKDSLEDASPTSSAQARRGLARAATSLPGGPFPCPTRQARRGAQRRVGRATAGGSSSPSRALPTVVEKRWASCCGCVSASTHNSSAAVQVCCKVCLGRARSVWVFATRQGRVESRSRRNARSVTSREKVARQTNGKEAREQNPLHGCVNNGKREPPDEALLDPPKKLERTGAQATGHTRYFMPHLLRSSGAEASENAQALLDHTRRTPTHRPSVKRRANERRRKVWRGALGAASLPYASEARACFSVSASEVRGD